MKSADDFDLQQIFTVEALRTHPIFLGEISSPEKRAFFWTAHDWMIWTDAKSAGGGAAPPPLPNHEDYWEAFKTEFKIFLCTKNRKYQKLRKDVMFYGHQSQVVGVGIISAGIGAYLGVAAGVITPLVVICLITALKIGKEAYCKTTNIDSIAPLTGDPNPRPSAWEQIVPPNESDDH